MTVTSGSLSNFVSVILVFLVVIIIGVAIIAVCHFVAKHILIKLVDKTFGKKHSGLGKTMFKNRLFHRVAYLIPVIFLYHFSYWFNFDYPHFKIYLADLVRVFSEAYIIFGGTFVAFAALNCVDDRYRKLEIARQRPIKSYLQVVKIVLFCIAIVLAVSLISDRSPMYFLTGIGALAAVFMLVFKDSILGFVASVQLAAYDMVRIGDLIEMPNFGADGEVIDISLNTVKVQNSDKSIVTIPSYALLTSGIKNWRGMKEAGGRRIKRAINIDISSIKICDQKLWTYLSENNLLVESLNGRKKQRITNIAIFRYYLQSHIEQYPGVRQDMRVMVRQLQGTATGLPIELYFFISETSTEQYEIIQADIFDDIYAVLPEFDLRVFQYASGHDDE